MSMDHVFHPNIRKWISPLFNIAEMTEKLRIKEDALMAPIITLPDFERTRIDKLETARKEDDEKLKAFKATLFGPKARAKTKVPTKLDSTTDEDQMDYNTDTSDLTEDSEYISSDVESDDETELRNWKKKFRLVDDLYMFDSDTSSEGEIGNTESEEILMAEAIGAEEGGAGGAPEVPLPQDTTEQDNKEFKNYFQYVGRHAEKAAARSLEQSRKEMILLLMTEMNFTRHKAEAHFNGLTGPTSPQLAFSSSEVIVEDPLIKGSVMPVLAGPIPNEVLQAQGTLALYVGLSDEPGNFQWRMGHVVEILSSQVKGNLRLLREDNIESPEDQKCIFSRLEAIATITIYQPVEEVDDILIEMRTIPEPEFGFEVEILSSLCIGDLCEMFVCQADLVYTEPFGSPDFLPAINSEAIDLYGDRLAKNVYPWKAIFIHDTIYVNFDMELPDFPGAKRVQDWAKCHRMDHGIGEIKFSNNMATKLSELNVQLGYPYAYIHQSTNCEHLWCFTSVRLPRPVEHSIFPRKKRIGKFPTKYCVIDNEVLARWAVTDCPRLPQNPMFLCTNCVKDYCYSRKDGSKSLGDFKLYPFFQLIHNI